jgi:hypothetical protein
MFKISHQAEAKNELIDLKVVELRGEEYIID